MKYQSGNLIFSPSDLIQFMESEFAAWMDRYNCEHPEEAVPDEDDESLAVLQKKGIEHEKRFLQTLIEDGKDVVRIPSGEEAQAISLQAMKDGREIIYQAAIGHEQFRGFADFLVKVPGKSDLGEFHYVPWDTKLALKPKPYYMIQLCCLAEILQANQGVFPAGVSVVLGSSEIMEFRTADYFYYYKQLKDSFLQQQELFNRDDGPIPATGDGNGRWNTVAKDIIEKRDHLIKVANIRATQIRKLEKAGIITMRGLADCKDNHVPGMHPATFSTLKNQARIQVESIGLKIPKYEIITPTKDNPRRGLALLPPASPNDVWFDMEGYPHIRGGLEYLFGATYLDSAGSPQFIDWWAHNAEEERKAFEGFIDWAYERWLKDPALHIYHYAAYEVSATRRLMGRYGTREEEVDSLLRNEVFVDLFRVVQQGLRVGEPRYSLKNIEHLYMPKRGGDVAKATDSIVFYERWLEQQDGSDYTTSQILKDIRDYNKIDCDSTWLLTDWLRERQFEASIKYIAKPPKSDEDEDKPSGRPGNALARQMLAEVSTNSTQTPELKQLKELLAYLLEFHRRELKSVWWAMFDRHEMTEEQLIDDLDCLGGLRRSGRPAVPVKKSRLVEYTFDQGQDTKLAAGKSCYFADDLSQKVTIDALDLKTGSVTLKFGPKVSTEPQHLSLIPDEYVNPGVIEDSIFRQVEAWQNGGPLSGAIEDFLLRRRPSLKTNASGPVLTGTGTQSERVNRAIAAMNNTTMCIQGPPGTGKTYTAAHAIAALLKDGKIVGVSSNSHKAVAHLLDKAAEVASSLGIRVSGAKVQSKPEDFHATHGSIQPFEKIADVFASKNVTANLIGGTAWAFSNAASQGCLDYLFVDEAGQVSIANLLGMAASTDNIVVMGDQMQLSQPTKGAHPGDSGLSCLDYLLHGKETIPDDFGIFLGTTHRMHPSICKFISESIYEGRLQSEEITKSRVLVVPSASSTVIPKSAGIVFHPVAHEGNTQHSEEEVLAIAELVKELQSCSIAQTPTTPARKIELKDILIVAPYNMQVRAIVNHLPLARVGTVDKFQGQEAPVVIVSMSASDAADSARGLEFLLSKNRMNVAISRAQSLAILVANPNLAKTACTNLEQLKLVNLLARIVVGDD